MSRLEGNKIIELLNNRLVQIKSNELPGHEAHLELTPYRSGRIDEIPAQAKKGGVAVILVESTNPSIILTKRASYDGVHGGQISFPGGKSDPQDLDLLHTAIRETKEEIGMDLLKNNHIRELTQLYIPPSNFLVHPHLFTVQGISDLKPNSEVDYIIELDLIEFISMPIHTTDIKLHGGLVIKDAPCFNYKGEIIWGATAAILNELRWILKP